MEVEKPKGKHKGDQAKKKTKLTSHRKCESESEILQIPQPIIESKERDPTTTTTSDQALLPPPSSSSKSLENQEETKLDEIVKVPEQTLVVEESQSDTKAADEDAQGEDLSTIPESNNPQLVAAIKLEIGESKQGLEEETVDQTQQNVLEVETPTLNTETDNSLVDSNHGEVLVPVPPPEESLEDQQRDVENQNETVEDLISRLPDTPSDPIINTELAEDQESSPLTNSFVVETLSESEACPAEPGNALLEEEHQAEPESGQKLKTGSDHSEAEAPENEITKETEPLSVISPVTPQPDQKSPAAKPCRSLSQIAHDFKLLFQKSEKLAAQQQLKEKSHRLAPVFQKPREDPLKALFPEIKPFVTSYNPGSFPAVIPSRPSPATEERVPLRVNWKDLSMKFDLDNLNNLDDSAITSIEYYNMILREDLLPPRAKLQVPSSPPPPPDQEQAKVSPSMRNLYSDASLARRNERSPYAYSDPSPSTSTSNPYQLCTPRYYHPDVESFALSERCEQYRMEHNPETGLLSPPNPSLEPTKQRSRVFRSISSFRQKTKQMITRATTALKSAFTPVKTKKHEFKSLYAADNNTIQQQHQPPLQIYSSPTTEAGTSSKKNSKLMNNTSKANDQHDPQKESNTNNPWLNNYYESTSMDSIEEIEIFFQSLEAEEERQKRAAANNSDSSSPAHNPEFYY